MGKEQLSSHGKYNTEYHISWKTKYGHSTLTSAMREKISNWLCRVLEASPGCEMVECNVLADHIHMIAVIPPKYAVSDIVGQLKGITSSKLLARYEDLEEPVWSPGYFVKTVGVPEDTVLEYVRNQ